MPERRKSPRPRLPACFKAIQALYGPRDEVPPAEREAGRHDLAERQARWTRKTGRADGREG